MNLPPLQLQQVCKQYGGKTAVNGISFEIAAGEIYGLLGGNGAGKTTTMRMVLGLIYPDDGGIRYHGRSYSRELLPRLGYLPEERGLYPKLKVDEQLIYLARLRGMDGRTADKNLKKWLEKFNIAEYYNRKVEELSKGNQQKIQFIAAVIHNPGIIVLDEAFSGLDPVNVELLKSAVKELRDSGKTILFSTHRMEHVEELCRNITILHKSNPVLQGSVAEIKSRFPRERVLVDIGGQELHGLENIPHVRQVTRHEHGYEVNIARAEAAQLVLQHALAQGDLTRFEIVEPTLNEIFIRTVGEAVE
ncbi:ABC transporter ATP-binding protein [Paenibacillus xerothermodurans]|uniref:ATP-binding cassette domain-containing protein n=1 Tax=Paenibacillus xerothermodurans TaxID=1977292 RepID=A0A2W1NYW3_PAEXE|nr:ABC transporter ATP-binding protein [Paenibacillus xerothermodurans]PZE20038.1 ATP-binding cassette domain-containing protein [Paenibacillus xerothermodurans]